MKANSESEATSVAVARNEVAVLRTCRRAIFACLTAEFDKFLRREISVQAAVVKFANIKAD
jgi:hypothetical protein